MDDFILAIVKAQAVPRGVLVPVSWVEILVGVTCQVAQTLHFVLHGVGMYDVHDDGNAFLMGSVYQFLQFLGRAKTAACREEAADVIAERAIIGMFLYGHDLYAVVSVLYHAGQDVFLELLIRAHLLRVFRHADVAFIDKQRIYLGFEGLFLPHVRLWVPYLRGEYLGIVILYYSLCPGGNALALPTLPVYLHLV